MKSSDRISIFKTIYPYFKRHRAHYAALGALKIYALILSLITPLIYMILVNDVMIDKKINLLWLVVLGYIGIYLLQTLGVALSKRAHNTLYSLLKVKLKKKILSVYSHMGGAEYERYNVGDLKNRLDSDIEAVEKFLNIHCMEFYYAALSALVISVIMLAMNWTLALVGFIAVPLSFLFARFMSKKAGELSNEYRETYGRYESFIQSSFQNWQQIKSACLEDSQSEVVKGYWDKLSPLFVKKQVYWYLNRGFVAFKDFFITKMNLYFVGGLLIISGHMNIGLLLSFMSYYAQFFANIEKMTDSIMELKTDRASIDRVTEMLQTEIAPKEKADVTTDDIAVNNIIFKYSEQGQTALNDISFKVNSKQHIAIVGRSGCGKTTLIKLVLGVYPPDSGEVLVGGYDINKYECSGIKLGAVMQEPYLFNLTIRENLLFAKPDATGDELDAACDIAYILDFIKSLPDGYDTVIGEKGVKLSGGQRQRMAIARTALLNPDILIFDEATSSLDYESEKLILATVKSFSAEKTMITIAHRLSTIQDCEHIVVIDRGQVVGEGSHEELFVSNETYHRLFAGQVMH